MADDHLLKAAVEDRCEELAEQLLGRPSSKSRREIRWGSHGKIRLKLATARWSDFSTGDYGDIFDLAKRELGVDFAGACDWAREQLSMPKQRRQVRPEVAKADDEDSPEARAQRARVLYLNSKPAGAFGFRYLDARGLDYPEAVEKQLRFNSVWFHGFLNPERALIMPFRSITTMEVRGVHKIALDAATEDGRRVKRSAGEILGSAMMLGPKGPRLAICEGLETGIGIMMGEPGTSVWCLSGASFMSQFAPIEGVEELVIYADNDGNKAGQAAAEACALLWSEMAEVTIRTPTAIGNDFADVYRRA